MLNDLESLVQSRISVLTTDGRLFCGNLRGFDQTVNIILEDAEERVYSMEDPVDRIAMGAYFIRGDTVAVLGQVDVEVDDRIDLGSARAAPIKPIIHGA